MADNKNQATPDQRQRGAQGDTKAPKAGEKPVGNVGNQGGNRDIGGDPNKNKMSPGIDQDRSRQGNQGNQGNNPGGQGQGQGMSNQKVSPDKDRASQNVGSDDDERSTQRARPNLDSEDLNSK